ncbi:hypothetical protein AnigIFM63604_011004 [Aspergillus niger]|uniref:Uncharacterized protein n=1 Tax=Aspergillus niger TaxID=5061 RepID=A0A9W6A8M5_ASPNG|nr:hypothetical protein AnigIFM63604_011004 [Aspergillus niger]
MIANDNLIEGGGGSPSLDYLINNQANAQTESYISKALFGFAIPSVWAVSGTASFVVNSGYDCSAQSPLTDYMTASSQNIATITNEAIFKYASNVSVGAKGYMECGGNAGKKVGDQNGASSLERHPALPSAPATSVIHRHPHVAFPPHPPKEQSPAYSDPKTLPHLQQFELPLQAPSPSPRTSGRLSGPQSGRSKGIASRVVVAFFRLGVFDGGTRDVHALVGQGEVVARETLDQLDVGFVAVLEDLEVKAGFTVGVDDDSDGHFGIVLMGQYWGASRVR